MSPSLLRLAAFAACGVVASAPWGCGSNPSPFAADSGAGSATTTATLTVGFSGTGSGTVSIASDAVAAGATNANATCSATCTEQYPTTASVNLVATAASDSIFDGWDPATSDSSCPTVSLAANVTCTATFRKLAPLPDGGDDAGSGVDAGGGAKDGGDGGG